MAGHCVCPPPSPGTMKPNDYYRAWCVHPKAAESPTHPAPAPAPRDPPPAPHSWQFWQLISETTIIIIMVPSLPRALCLPRCVFVFPPLPHPPDRTTTRGGRPAAITHTRATPTSSAGSRASGVVLMATSSARRPGGGDGEASSPDELKAR